MVKIVAMIQPFSMRQNLYVYEDGNKIASAQPTIEEINETVFDFIHDYGVNQLDLVGSKQYNRGLSKKIQAAEMAKFNKNILEINII